MTDEDMLIKKQILAQKKSQDVLFHKLKYHIEIA